MKKQFKSLGSKILTPGKPSVNILETFEAPKGIDNIEFETDEFTSKCPITGQPDFCYIRIIYHPNKLCVESKSLKLYLQSYRNENGFIEELCVKITNDFVKKIKPHFVRVVLKSTPRGGISVEARCSK